MTKREPPRQEPPKMKQIRTSWCIGGRLYHDTSEEGEVGLIDQVVAKAQSQHKVDYVFNCRVIFESEGLYYPSCYKLLGSITVK